MEQIKTRNLLLYILFFALGILCTVLSCIPVIGIIFMIAGIVLIAANVVYRVYFLYSLSLDVDSVCKGDGVESGSYIVAVALSSVTFGLYNIYWTYKIGQRLHANAPRYGYKMAETGKDIAVLDAFSMGYISVYELIKNMNKIAKVYNRGIASGVYGGDR